MKLTAAQQAILKTYIEANPVWMALDHNSDGALTIATELREDEDPTAYVWRSDVSQMEMTGYTSDQGTDWDWSEFISRSAGEQRGFIQLFSAGSINAGKVNVRQGFVDIFSGTSGAAQRTHMAAISKRAANMLEARFFTGNGTLNSPGTLEVEGFVSYSEIVNIMGW